MIQPINKSEDEKEERLRKMIDVMFDSLHSGCTNMIEKFGTLECLKLHLIERYLNEDETGDSK